MVNYGNEKLIVILGATASGKTSLASNIALKLDAEIISADSRQVYKSMTIGTGKDYDDYIIEGKQIPVHLIDIAEPGYKYNVFEYQKDFLRTYNEISGRNKRVILCGGSGMYIESVLKSYDLIDVPENLTLRKELEKKADSELKKILESLKTLHNISDTSTRIRMIRAIEICLYYKEGRNNRTKFPQIDSIIFGVVFDRDSRRERITERLKERLKSGMIEEVESLLANGLSPEDLIFYGLEYKFITNFITGLISYDEMFYGLNTAIHQFSKRQMTWFRKMEKDGFKIHWIEGNISINEKINKIHSILHEENAN